MLNQIVIVDDAFTFPSSMNLLETRTDDRSSYLVVEYRGHRVAMELIEGHDPMNPKVISLRGHAASSTGYRSFAGSPITIDQSAEHLDRSYAFPFLLGDHDAPGVGWRMLGTCYSSNRIQIRVPNWTGDDIRTVLTSIGFLHTCKLNDYYCAPNDWTSAMVREALLPMQKTGSRMAAQQDLAQELAIAYQGSAARNVVEQGSLF